MRRKYLILITGFSIFLLLFVRNSLLKDNLQVKYVENKPKDSTQVTLSSTPTLIYSQTAPNGLYRGKLYRGSYIDKEKYYEFFVTNFSDGLTKKVFSGTPRTLDVKWTEDSKIKITYNCGTGCRATKTIDVDDYVAIADYKDGKMNKENGWDIQFAKSTF